ncbi:MAG: hypothetical protein K2P50_11810 [Lachnospiraceae bacterium]|nr:hypothetical protein [Lachnospiraceae bacterium]
MKKKKTKVYKMRKIKSPVRVWAAAAAAICLLSGMMLTVYGEEKDSTGVSPSQKVTVTNIYHRHIGSPDAAGGCYTAEIAHIHEGDEQNGGECFRTEVAHVHQGDAAFGGGCYGKGIPHAHQDSCYETHTHGDGCFQTIKCDEIYTNVEPGGTIERECQNHGTTTFVVANSVLIHSACGKEPSNVTVYYCQICNHYQNTWHSAKQKICDYEEGDIDYNSVICGKEGDDAVDGYETDCGFDDGAVESYEKSCDKTIDGYETGCGLREDEPLGKLILTSEITEDGAKAHVLAKVEDLSGRLILGDNPFTWRDTGGNVIGNSDFMEVEENGKYSVTLNLVNKDVDESGLRGSILVDGIFKEGTDTTPQPTKTPEASPVPPSGGSEGKDDNKEENGNEKDDGDDKDDEDDEDKGEGDGGDSGPADGGKGEAGKKTAEKTPGATPEKTLSGEVSKNAAGIYTGRKYDRENAGQSPSPSSSPKRQFRVAKETVTVEAKENKAAEEVPVRIGQAEKKSGFFDSPVARVITITAGAVFLIAAVLFWLAFLRRSVKIYNDDGEGKMRYLGRCLVHREEEVYFLAISDEMVEKSYTNRYRIKPGIFRFGKEEGEELIIYKEGKKAVVPLSREMIVLL